MVKKGLTALGLLLTMQIILLEHFTENNLRLILCVALCDLIPFVQFKKCEKHPRGLLLLVIYGNITT